MLAPALDHPATQEVAFFSDFQVLHAAFVFVEIPRFGQQRFGYLRLALGSLGQLGSYLVSVSLKESRLGSLVSTLRSGCVFAIHELGH